MPGRLDEFRSRVADAIEEITVSRDVPHTSSMLERLTSAVNAISSRSGDVVDRIKSIAQVALEIISCDSILVYGKNQVTGRLELIAMPGVVRKEIMRGPANRLIFESLSRNATDTERWWENWWSGGEEYDRSVRQLEACKLTRSKSTGRFRQRELEAKHGGKGDWATAQIYLIKGLNDTNDVVGQTFFNFWFGEPNGCPLFTDELRETVRYISIVFRELLIEREFHQEDRSVAWDPTWTLGRADLLFSRLQEEETGREMLGRLRSGVAQILCEAASRVAATYTGEAEFGYVIGDRVAEIYNARDERPRYAELTEDSVLRKPDFREYMFVSNDVKAYYRREKDLHQALQSAYSAVDLFNVRSGSIMVVPVHSSDSPPTTEHYRSGTHNRRRAFFLLTSPKTGVFLDKNAWAIQSLASLADYLLMRLESESHRHYMKPAFDFYRESGLVAERMSGLMSSLLNALNAEWGTFWKVQKQKDGEYRITEGWKFEDKKGGTAPWQVTPDDRRVGIRHRGHIPEGYTRFLLECNDHGTNDVALVMHMLGEERKGFCTPTCWSQNVKNGQLWCDRRGVPCHVVRDYPLNRNTWRGGRSSRSLDTHTRIAFAVKDGERIVGVVWLKLQGLREIGSWEQQFVAGLGRSVGVFLRHQELQWGLTGFRHEMNEHLQNIKDYVNRVPADEKDLQWRLKGEAHLRAIEYKAQEVDFFQRKGVVANDAFEYKGDIRTYLDIALRVAHDHPDLKEGGTAKDRWRLLNTARLGTVEVALPAFTALLNLCTNAVYHALLSFKEDEKKHLFKCWFWIEEQGDAIRVIVANTRRRSGKPMTDPFDVEPGLAESEHVGLHFARAAIGKVGGQLMFLDEGRTPSALKEEMHKVPDNTCEWVLFDLVVPMTPVG